MRLRAVALILIVFVLMVTPVHLRGQDDGMDFRRLTDDEKHHSSIDINGQEVVWTESETRDASNDIVVYDLQTETRERIPKGDSRDPVGPVLTDRFVVWKDIGYGTEGLYLFDRSKGVTRLVVDSEERSVYGYDASGEYVVYSGAVKGGVATDLFLYNVSEDETIRVTQTPDAEDSHVVMSEGRIVWVDWDNDQQDISLYNVVTGDKRRITNDPYGQSEPDISGQYIVWEDLREAQGRRKGNDIYMYDLKDDSERALSRSQDGTQKSPAVAGTLVTWTSGNELYLYDIKREHLIKVTEFERRAEEPGIHPYGPNISEGHLVWRGARGLDGKNKVYHLYIGDDR